MRFIDHPEESVFGDALYTELADTYQDSVHTANMVSKQREESFEENRLRHYLKAQPPPLPAIVLSSATQTTPEPTPSPPTTNNVSTQTKPAPSIPTSACQSSRRKWDALNRLRDLDDPAPINRDKGKGKEHKDPDTTTKDKGKGKSTAPPSPTPPPARLSTVGYESLSDHQKEADIDVPWTDAVVVHAVKTNYPINDISRWLANDNSGITVSNARWLLAPHRRTGKQHSSVVIYLSRSTQHPNQGIQLGGRRLRTTNYDRSR